MSSQTIKQLCEDSLQIKNSDPRILFKQQTKQNKMTFQGQHISCEEAKTQAQPRLTDNVDEERQDAYRGIPKLRFMRLLEILIWDALGIPKLELLCLLNSSHIMASPKSLKTSSTQNSTRTREISQYKSTQNLNIINCRKSLKLYLNIAY